MNPSGSRLRGYKYRIAGKENLFATGEYPRRARHATVPANSSRRDRTVSCATRSAAHAPQ
ncbi:hypothetical protein [Burkholderia ambifaria]|uniref:hypothetical protein n=1 Tax=Burkholderia ambifaria TaxID=152480 RepID=UPI00358E4C67